MKESMGFCLCENCVHFRPIICNDYLGECALDEHQTVSICRACDEWEEDEE